MFWSLQKPHTHTHMHTHTHTCTHTHSLTKLQHLFSRRQVSCPWCCLLWSRWARIQSRPLGVGAREENHIPFSFPQFPISCFLFHIFVVVIIIIIIIIIIIHFITLSPQQAGSAPTLPKSSCKRTMQSSPSCLFPESWTCSRPFAWPRRLCRRGHCWVCRIYCLSFLPRRNWRVSGVCVCVCVCVCVQICLKWIFLSVCGRQFAYNKLYKYISKK